MKQYENGSSGERLDLKLQRLDKSGGGSKQGKVLYYYVFRCSVIFV